MLTTKLLPARLLNTTAIRVSLRYALYYALLTGIGLGLLYWATSRYVDAQVGAGLETELNGLVRIDREQGRRRLLQLLAQTPDVNVENRRYRLLLGADGRRLGGELEGWPAALKADRRVRNIWIEDDLIPYRMADRDGYWPMIATTLPDGSRLLVAQSVRQAEDLQEFVLSAMAVLLLVTVGLTLVLGWRMGRRILARIDQINATARAIQRGDLARRVTVTDRGDEFDELATHLNGMLDHTEQLIKGMREVTDNVAHDLRRPLSRLRSRFEVTLLEARTEQHYRHVLEAAVTDIDGTVQTFNALLAIAQAEAGSNRGEWQSIDLSALCADIGALYRDLAREQGQRLRVELQPGLCIRGNRHLIGQAISNLLENALNHAGGDAAIVLQLSRQAEHAPMVLSVSDSGPGIDAGQRQHVLQRFVRLDHSRSTPGNGLGLSLVAAVARLHRAKLELADNHPGLRVSLSLSGQRCG